LTLLDPRLSILASLFPLTHASPERLNEVRDSRLRRLVAHAYANVPYYRRLFDSAGVRPEHVRTAADLSRLPATSREQFQGLPLEELTARGVGRLRPLDTGGSSGRQITVYWTGNELRLANAIRFREMWLHGWKPGYRMVRFYNRQRSGGVGLLLARLGLHMAILWAQAPAATHLERLQQLRPHHVHGYASYVTAVAMACLERGVRLRPKMVVTSGDALLEGQRRLVEQAFAADPVEIYSCNEAGDIAWQCRPQKRFHVNSEAIIVETLGEDAAPCDPGAMGEVTLTSLYHYAMPKIRYQPGDLAVLANESCPCGNGHPTISALMGRRNEVIRLPDGDLITPIMFASLFRDYPRTQAYRLSQVSRTRLLLEVVAGPDLTPEALEQLRQRVVMLSRGQVEVDALLVAGIPRALSGKQKLIHADPRGDEEPQ